MRLSLSEELCDGLRPLGLTFLLPRRGLLLLFLALFLVGQEVFAE